jgi:hypothetical protein
MGTPDVEVSEAAAAGETGREMAVDGTNIQA